MPTPTSPKPENVAIHGTKYFEYETKFIGEITSDYSSGLNVITMVLIRGRERFDCSGACRSGII